MYSLASALAFSGAESCCRFITTAAEFKDSCHIFLLVFLTLPKVKRLKYIFQP